MLSFIGVNGFFISCATCLAISRQAPSLSLRARTAALSPNLLTVLLYSFTNSPISSLRLHTISSFIFPRFTSRILSPVSYTHLRAHETPEHLVCRLLLE